MEKRSVLGLEERLRRAGAGEGVVVLFPKKRRQEKRDKAAT